MPTATQIQYRPHTWCDVRDGSKMYGIEASTDGGKIWRHMAQNGRPLIYKSEKKRDNKLTKLRASKDPVNYVLALPA